MSFVHQHISVSHNDMSHRVKFEELLIFFGEHTDRIEYRGKVEPDHNYDRNDMFEISEEYIEGGHNHAHTGNEEELHCHNNGHKECIRGEVDAGKEQSGEDDNQTEEIIYETGS